MAYVPGPWVTVVQYNASHPSATPIIDLGRPFDYVQVQIPVINTGELKVEVSAFNTNTTFYPLGMRNSNGIAVAPVNHVGSTAGNFHTVLPLEGHQFIRFTQYAAQNANV